MLVKEFQLLTSQRFLPLFITQFFALFNDNIFKYTLIMLITFKVIEDSEKAQLLINLIGGIYGSAFLFFSITIGQLADKFNRVMIIQLMKFLEIILIAVGMVSIYFNDLNLSLFIIFLLGLHSAFLSPIKFSLLPDLLPPEELLAGNSLIAAGVMTAIFAGAILSIFFGGHPETAIILCGMALLFAILSWIASFYIFKVPCLDPTLKINLKDIYNLICYVIKDKKIFFPIIGIAWSIFIAVVFVRQFPIYTKLFISEKQIFVLTLFGPFAAGAIMGALLCRLIFKNLINPLHTAFSLLLLSLFLFDFAWTTSHITAFQLTIPSVESFRIFFDIFLFALATGIYIVPLYVNLQVNSNPAHRARVMAINNFVISLFAVFAALFVIILIRRHFSIAQIYVILGILNIIMVIYFFTASRS